MTYIGGKINGLGPKFQQKKLKNSTNKNLTNSLTENIFQSFYGRGYFALRSILKAQLKSINKLTLHAPEYNCWFTFNLAIQNLENIELKIYSNQKELNDNIKKSEHKNCVLLIDYFGISTGTTSLKALEEKDCVVIVDLAHAFPTMEHIKNVMDEADYSFISLRKILPVPDGAIAYSKHNDLENHGTEKRPSIYWRALSFLSKFQTLDNMADFTNLRYKLFKAHEESLVSNTYSKSALDLFSRLDLTKSRNQRLQNYNTLYTCESLRKNLTNLTFEIRERDISPSYFPFMPKEVKVMQIHLARHKIYCPIFWPGLKKDCQILGLPIDERYELKHMKKIIHVIRSF